MAMVSVVYWQPEPTGGLMAWSKDQQPPCTGLYSLHEPGELSQCSKHDDSRINIILVLLLLL